jgi:hypothetical protein
MKMRTLKAIVSVLGIAVAGCGKHDQPAASLEATNAVLPAAAVPAVQVLVTVWREGKESEAVTQFLRTDWSARPLFASDSILSLTEAQFQSQVESLPTAGDVQYKRSQMMTEVDAIKQLAAKVAQAGAEAASTNNLVAARQHFTSLAQCGDALDSSNSVALVRLVGQGIKKRAATEMSKLPQ